MGRVEKMLTDSRITCSSQTASFVPSDLLRHELGIPRIPRDFWVVESTALCSLISSKYS